MAASIRQSLHVIGCLEGWTDALLRRRKRTHRLNLLDAEQPLLYYGCLSSHLSLDHEAIDRVTHMRAKVGAVRLHANDLGNGGLAVIAQELADLQRCFGLQFGVYRVAKPDHAIVCFFDQVFDSAMNPAIICDADTSLL